MPCPALRSKMAIGFKLEKSFQPHHMYSCLFVDHKGAVGNFALLCTCMCAALSYQAHDIHPGALPAMQAQQRYYICAGKEGGPSVGTQSL